MRGLNVSTEFDALLGRLDGVSQTLTDDAARADETGELTEKMVAALHETGAFKVGLPAEIGGYEFSPTQLIDTIVKLSYVDASTGWAFMAVQLATGTTAAYLDPDTVHALFPNVAGGEFPLMAGQGTRPGTATRVEGGYRLTGRWSFASGVAMASHVHSAGFCAETGQALVFTTPRDQVRFLGNWDVLGLRATGSVDYAIDDVFVPDNYAYDNLTTEPRVGGAVFRLGIMNLANICHTAWAIGVGRRLLDELRSFAVSRTGTPRTPVDTDVFHTEFARAEAKLRAATAWAREVWTDNERILDRGEHLDLQQETLTRLALNNCTWSVHEVGQMVYKWATTTALRDGPLQRLFRDLHAGTQHITSGPAVLGNCGKWLAGLAPDAEWVFLDLKENAPS